MVELPEVDPTRCTGCGDCVGICPAHCLGLGRGTVWLPRPDHCVSCAACVLVCPEDALTMMPPEDA